MSSDKWVSALSTKKIKQDNDSMNVTNIATKFNRYALIVSTLLVLSSLSLTASANLIRNPGFETPITNTTGTPNFDWLAFGSNGNPFGSRAMSQNSVSMPRTGSQSLELQINNLADQFAGVFQDVGGLTGGQSVVLSGWLKSLLDADGVEIRIEWRNALADTEIERTANVIPTFTDEFLQFSFSDFVPTGADTARVVYVIQSSGAGNNQLVYLDDVSFEATAVSTPNMLALFGLGLFGISFARRHSVRSIKTQS
jgi:hypothetical protein